MGKQEQSMHDLASWFLSKQPMSQKKLQKLCYYAVAWGYALLDKPIVKDPEFEAWVHGPVSKTLWNTYSIYGWENISNKTSRWQKLNKNKLTLIDFPQEVVDVLKSVWVTYGDKSGLELEALSHKEAPWVNARKGVPAFARSSEQIIPNDMKVYYQSIYKQ